jgi:hypothetical protein
MADFAGLLSGIVITASRAIPGMPFAGPETALAATIVRGVVVTTVPGEIRALRAS